MNVKSQSELDIGGRETCLSLSFDKQNAINTFLSAFKCLIFCAVPGARVTTAAEATDQARALLRVM